MMNEKVITHISKFLSLVLRHKPENLGIELDKNGWVDVDLLIEKSTQMGIKLDKQTLKYIVETNPKKRFSFNETLDKIRANQGHSLNVDLCLQSIEPPEILYHGTGEKFVYSILNEGLKKKNRQHVHLSNDIETATKVGERHGKLFIFKVLAKEMHKDNFKFFLSDNGVWLTDNVPIKYLRMHKKK